jgi:large subunit ribosomal protein L10
MPSKRNENILASILDRIQDKPLLVTARFSNINAAQMNDLRRDVIKGGGRIFIAKNNLVKIAADKIGIRNIDTIIDGPTAYIVAEDDIASMVKALTTSIKGQRIQMEILGGVMENELINASRVEQIADLPSRDQLIAMLASTLNGPLTSFTRVLNAPVQNLASALEQIADQRRTAENEASEEEA